MSFSDSDSDFESDFFCEPCNLIISLKSDWDYHQTASYHLEAVARFSVVRCDICNMQFAKRADLSEHEKTEIHVRMKEEIANRKVGDDDSDCEFDHMDKKTLMAELEKLELKRDNLEKSIKQLMEEKTLCELNHSDQVFILRVMIGLLGLFNTIGYHFAELHFDRIL